MACRALRVGRISAYTWGLQLLIAPQAFANRHYVARLRADGSVAFCRELPTVAAEDPALTGKGLNPQGLCTTPRGVIWMGTVEAYNAPVQSLHHVLIELDSNGHNPISHTIYWPYNVLMGVPRYHGGKLYFTGSAYYSTSGQVYRNFVGRISYPDFTLERGITFGIGTQGTLFYGLADHTWDVLSNGEVAISCAGPELRAIGGFTGTSTAFTIRLDTALRVKHAFEYRGICTAPFRSSGEGCLAATSNGRYVAATYLDGPVNQGYWQNGVFAPDTSDRVCNYQHPLALQQPDAFLPGYNLQPPRTLPELPTIALRAEPALWLADSLPQPDMRQVCTPTPARRLGLRLLGPDTTVCQASYTTGILGGMVSIDGAAFVANPGQITFTASGLHTITVFDSCNASNYLSDTLKLVLGGRPVGLPDTTIRACAGDTILVGASPQGPGPFLWRDERGAQVQTTRLGRFVFDDTGRSIIYHKVFYTGSLVCLSTDSQLVAVQPRLPRTLPDTIGLCAGRDTLLDGATWYPAVRDFLWSVPGGLLRDRPYNTSTPGRYRLRFDVGGCAQRDSLYIKTRDTIRLRIVQYGPSEPCRDSVYLIVQTGTASVFGEYAWREDGQPFLPEADGRIHGKRGHTYTAAISNECGPIPIPPFSVAPKPDSCTHILPPPPVLPLKIYNMVTPNGDHKNDYFIVENAPPNAAYQLAVYSRWGARVYNDGYQPTGWPLADTQSGTYFYRLITDKQVFTGWVEVVR